MSSNNLERRLQEIGPEAFEREVREGLIPSLSDTSNVELPELDEAEDEQDFREAFEEKVPETKR